MGFSVALGSNNGFRLHVLFFARGQVLATLFFFGPELVAEDTLGLAKAVDQRVKQFSP